MPVRIITQAEVAGLLPMAACMDVMAEALKTLARGDAVLPLRPVMTLPDHSGLLGMMPAYLGQPKAIGLKVITIFPANEGTEYESHQGAVLLFEPKHGSLIGVMDAAEITAIRTAAVSGVATRLLAREDAGDLAILGAGVQATTHLQAMRTARPLRRVRVWSRNRDHARRFAARESRRQNVTIEPCSEAREAVEGADIICTVTSAGEPVLRGAWLAAGAHINAVGSSTAAARELDTAAVLRSRLYVDRRESALHEAGDFLIPKAEGAIGDDHIQAEIGDILLRKAKGRTSRDEITLFKSLGIAVEDAAAAQYIYDRAEASGTGIAIELGGKRHDDE